MKTKNFILYCIFVGLILALSSCYGSRHYNNDPFYSSTGEWDSVRFPLIKPYQITNLEMGNGWGMQLHVSPLRKEIYWYLGVHDIEKISVAKGIILVYTQYKPEVDEDAGQKVLYWFVIDPDKEIEKGFDSENDFLRYIGKYGIKKPSWESPESIFQRFKETGCLDWIPDCK